MNEALCEAVGIDKFSKHLENKDMSSEMSSSRIASRVISRQQPIRKLQRDPSAMISREEAMKSLEKLNKDDNLPEVLKENHI